MEEAFREYLTRRAAELRQELQAAYQEAESANHRFQTLSVDLATFEAMLKIAQRETEVEAHRRKS